MTSTRISTYVAVLGRELLAHDRVLVVLLFFGVRQEGGDGALDDRGELGFVDGGGVGIVYETLDFSVFLCAAATSATLRRSK